MEGRKAELRRNADRGFDAKKLLHFSFCPSAGIRILPSPLRTSARDPSAREELEKWLWDLEESRRVLRVEGETAKFHADIVADLRSRGWMIPMNDVWIAALALQHDLPGSPAMNTSTRSQDCVEWDAA